MPSIDPRASPPGKMWQATATSRAPVRASTARSHSLSSIIFGFLQRRDNRRLRHPGLPEKLLDALAVGAGGVLEDLQPGEVLQPDLAPHGGPPVSHPITSPPHRGPPPR